MNLITRRVLGFGAVVLCFIGGAGVLSTVSAAAECAPGSIIGNGSRVACGDSTGVGPRRCLDHYANGHNDPRTDFKRA